MTKAERTDFIRGIRSQTDKLDFLFQALVKTSRLETGVIQLNKKPGRLFDTVAQAMSGIVYAAEKKEIAVSVDCPEDLAVSHDSLGVNLRTSYQLSTVFDDLRNVDICPLATAEEVIAGHVPVIFPVVRQQTAVYYTPRSYAKHLQNIIRIMDTHPDYFFVPIQYDPDDNVCIIVNEGSEAILIRTALPSMVFDFNHPQIVQNFQEYLYKIANEIGYSDINRKKIRAQLKELINVLEKA